MRREKKTAATAWLETWNPLRGMSIREAQNIFDVSRQGDTQRLHWMFQEIEATNPVLLVCVERRASAIANFRWKIAEIAARDEAVSEEQKDAAERFLNGIANFTDALEHLDLAFFRGFAHAQPVWEADGTVKEISLLDSWKFVRQGGEWYYNPKCTGFVAGDMQETTNARLMTITRRRPIDYPALGIHIRHAVGSRDWGRFLERYALPKPAVFMHPNATNEQRADYLEGAQAVENGQVSVWPNGASLTDFAGGARGTDPFGAFIEHQEKQIVLLATGGTLMSLAESGSGTLAGNAQSDVWHSIVARDSSVIAQCVQKGLVEPYLAAAFPGQPCAVRFGFDFDETPTAKEVFEIAALAKQAGWSIDQQQLEEATGYTLVRDEVNAASALNAAAPLNAAARLSFANKAEPGGARPRTGEGRDALAAFAKDSGPAAEAIKALLSNPSKAACEKLLGELPALLPDDPALAAVIAEEMAKAFTDTGREGRAPSRPVENKQGECQSDDPAHCRVHSVPETRPLSEQLAELGYADRNDVNRQADGVSQERIAQVISGNLKEHCEVHEAVAALRKNPTVTNAFGKKVTFGNDMILHYLGGYERSGNQPDAKRLKELPLAIHAVIHCTNPRLQYPKGVAPDPLNPPRGTQYVYHEKVGDGDMLCRAWVDSGKVKGWFVK